MAEFVLGVDGGSSKTHLALADRAGRLAAFVAGPGTNHEWQGMAPVKKVFAMMTARACRQAGCRPSDIRAACFGLSGGDIASDFVHLKRDTIDPLGLGGPVRVSNDAFLPLFNDKYRDKGAAVTHGSWHKWLAMNGNRFFMHEGAHIFGIRQLAVTDVAKVCEGFRRPSPHTDRLLKYLGFSGYLDYFERTFYGGEKRAWVRRLPPGYAGRFRRIPEWLGREAARGSREALKVLDANAAQLVEGTMATVRMTGLTGKKFEVVLSGSVLAGIPALRRFFARRLAALEPGARTMGAPGKPVRGALNFAAHMAWDGFPSGSLKEPALWYRQP